MRPRVVIIGGGIAGLAASYALNGTVRSGLLAGVTLIEAGSRLGGKVHTERVDGFVIEAGADSFVTAKPAAVDLCTALGLANRLMTPRPPHAAYVLHRGRLEPLPEGLAMLVPSRLSAVFRSALFSLPEKLRMALEMLVLPRRDTCDESIGQFVTRRLGRAPADRVAAPLLAGIHAGDVDQLSVRATFPHLVELERRHGSLTLAGLARRWSSGHADGERPLFMTLIGGLQELVDRLTIQLDSIVVRTRCAAEAITTGADLPYTVRLSSGEQLPAHAVVVATPAYAAARLLRAANLAAASLADAVPYASTAVVALGFRREDVGHPLAGHGFVVPPAERRSVTGCTWVSSKWAHRAPADHVLLRCYTGTATDQRALDLDEAALVRQVVDELTPLLSLARSPVLTRVYRWHRAMPQYVVGHLDRLAALDRALQQTPGIVLAGAGYRGVGIPDCIRQGIEAAQGILALFSRPVQSVREGMRATEETSWRPGPRWFA